MVNALRWWAPPIAKWGVAYDWDPEQAAERLPVNFVIALLIMWPVASVTGVRGRWCGTRDHPVVHEPVDKSTAPAQPRLSDLRSNSSRLSGWLFFDRKPANSATPLLPRYPRWPANPQNAY
jgi:hypothetical protein